ncbi:MAG: hypothetical protein RL497_115 [Pseudomonadota bacterium]
MHTLQFKKSILFITTLLLLAGCGSGGKSNNSTPQSPSPTTITPNAGADKIAKTGDFIELVSNTGVVGGDSYTLGAGEVDVKGKSNVGTDVVRITWTKLSGPPVALSSDGTTKATARFTAPSTGTEPFVNIVYQLTFYYGNGSTANDQITIRVNRVNQAPQVAISADFDLNAEDTINLSATAIDHDGRVVSYAWEQTAGAAATLSDKSILQPTLTAPAVASATDLEFSLKITDNEGATSTDTLKIHVLPKNTPRINVFFPPANSNFKGEKLAITGKVAGSGAEISSLTVIADGIEYPAKIAANGLWRVEDVSFPKGQTQLNYSVRAVDALDRTSTITSGVTKKELSGGDYLYSVDDVVNIAVDSPNKRVIILATGVNYRDGKLLSVDLLTGKLSSVISDFSNLAQGANPLTLTNMVWDAARKKVYAASSPADPAQKVQIISIDMQTGQRVVLSDSEHGSGPTLKHPTGLALGHNNNLYVADNVASAIVSVDLSNGNRQVIADENTLLFGIDAPLLLAIDPDPAKKRLFMVPNASRAPVFSLDLSGQVATTWLASQPDVLLSLDEYTPGIEYNPLNNELITINSSDRVVRTDVATGVSRSNVELGFAFNAGGYSFDADSQVIYFVSDLFSNLYAMDLVSGQTVQVSRGNQ